MVEVIMKAQTHKETFYTFETMEEALEVCELYGWEFMDENGFVWTLEID